MFQALFHTYSVQRSTTQNVQLYYDGKGGVRGGVNLVSCLAHVPLGHFATTPLHLYSSGAAPHSSPETMGPMMLMPFFPFPLSRLMHACVSHTAGKNRSHSRTDSEQKADDVATRRTSASPGKGRRTDGILALLDERRGAQHYLGLSTACIRFTYQCRDEHFLPNTCEVVAHIPVLPPLRYVSK